MSTDTFRATPAGRRRIECEPGQGGMAMVHLAHDAGHPWKIALHPRED